MLSGCGREPGGSKAGAEGQGGTATAVQSREQVPCAYRHVLPRARGRVRCGLPGLEPKTLPQMPGDCGQSIWQAGLDESTDPGQCPLHHLNIFPWPWRDFLLSATEHVRHGGFLSSSCHSSFQTPRPKPLYTQMRRGLGAERLAEHCCPNSNIT